MIIDKGLGLGETRDLLVLAGQYIDIVKISFGTSVLYSEQVLRDKIALIRSFGVDACPGGTLLEIAIIQGKVDAYLDRARELGFSFVEVSDGTITMAPAVRRDTIRRALAAGFTVLTEVGKKDPKENPGPLALRRQVEADLAEGVQAVIIEARESGKGVGIYGADGSVNGADLEEIAAGLPEPLALMWEAPLKNQQLALIKRFGPNVSLGNIPPADVLALEALRVGLRGDTLKGTLVAAP